MTVRAPSTKRYALNTIRYPAITGPGMELSSADTFGRKASAISMAPIQYPTLHEATPVVCV